MKVLDLKPVLAELNKDLNKQGSRQECLWTLTGTVNKPLITIAEPMVCDDVTCWSPEDYPEFNILTGGFPCRFLCCRTT